MAAWRLVSAALGVTAEPGGGRSGRQSTF